MARAPLVELPTHRVSNQPPPLLDYDVFEGDAALREAVSREGAEWAMPKLQRLGQAAGSARYVEAGFLANEHLPRLRTFDRYGQRIDEVQFHPAYHELMGLGMEYRLPSLPWAEPRAGAHVTHAAMVYLLGQAESGVLCPLVMTYAAVPALRHQPDVAEQWLPRLLDGVYDARCIPATEKGGVTIGMAMTEKQGGSDVRANETRATAIDAGGPGQAYRLRGHKWFCSAPMCDAFLTLAHTGDAARRELSCFLVPRWCPDGTRNRFFIQRLKDKLGNKANASSEIEYDDTWAVMVGPEGRGVRTIIEMVHHTRLDAAVAPVALMRQALTQAIHHTRHRRAFGRVLSEQPLMKAVLADLALEVEAGVAMVMRVARSFDEAEHDPDAARLSRLATAFTKYWTNKRAAGHVYEALECLGGAGYVEESMMPRLYREAPLNSIWEGSGNVICLDVLRAIQRDPECLQVLFEQLRPACEAEPRVADLVADAGSLLSDRDNLELRARQLCQNLALAFQASLLMAHAPPVVAEAFIAARISGAGARAYGALPPGVDVDLLIERAAPVVPG
ncbi:acyl-CoA dehydrogenase family protein [Paraliomyxa miuraensis]|uniref:acyl-CoA dehydrogenase family protein n=1 Tax=Paraliomyxa miuraensis TaxID=376150 RepID=UPI00224F2837|nr:acyl-CoA dehydrogenase family protein [Paraliomyxa miuraensis]MCX4242756.1 acyl-CoA dehydrogenase family protein [Paraliomyxa miuraensis]